MREKCIRFLDDLTDSLLTGFLKITLVYSVLVSMQTVRVYKSAADGSLKLNRDPSAQSRTDGYEQEAGMRLVIDDTQIDFCVMQGSDNTEYLTKDTMGNYSVSGSIFLDCRNSYDLSDPYNLIYGHHMSGQYMFGSLDLFKASEYLMKHRKGSVRTSGHVYAMHIFCCMKSDAYDEIVYDPDQFNREAFLQYAEGHAYVFEDPPAGRILVLSTCESNSLTGRTAVAAVIIEDERDMQKEVPALTLTAPYLKLHPLHRKASAAQISLPEFFSPPFI